MRTLVISDLHLGTRAGSDVLRRPAPLARLLDALDGIDRLVLLGDVLELIVRHPRAELDAAEPILRAIGRRRSSSHSQAGYPRQQTMTTLHDTPIV